jgi:methylated-DNA-protein-cysteine methyltransferase related protein
MRRMTSGSSRSASTSSKATSASHEGSGLYDRIYDLVDRIPRGRVASYGQLAALVGRCTPRMAGYAMAALPPYRNSPWHRVINSRGEVSTRRCGDGHLDQRALLEAEGVVFDARGRIDLEKHGWRGPSRPARSARPPRPAQSTPRSQSRTKTRAKGRK